MTTAPAPAIARQTWRTTGSLSFGGILRSEWLKFFSLRSMRWASAVTLVAGLGLAFLLSLTISISSGDMPPVQEAELAALGTQSATFGLMFTQLIMAVLGVLAITNEYSSGMILSTITAVPKRTPVFIAKALLVFVIGLVIGAIITFGGGIITTLVIPELSFSVMTRPEVLASLGGGAIFLALVALLSFGIGALVRSAAGGIAIVVGLLFVAPTAFQIMSMSGWAWVDVVASYLPSTLGMTLYSGATMTGDGMGYWQALAAMVVWVLAALIPAAILLKQRDTV